MSGCPSTTLFNKDQALGISWVNACVQETLLPGKPWYQVSERLEAAFAHELKHQVADSKQREIVFHLLGPKFVKRYFGDYPIRPESLSSTDVSESCRVKLLERTRIWLQNVCFKAAENLRFQFHFGTDAAELAPEMVHFLDDTYNIVTAELEWLLANCEARQKEKGTQESKTQLPLPRDLEKTSLFALQRPRSVESKNISLALSERPASPVDRNGKGFQKQIRPELHPPVLSCQESDVLGDLLCALIAQDPENMPTVCARLSGKLLPKTLRQFIWMDRLLRAGSGSCRAQATRLWFAEKEARENFGRTVARRLAELKLHSATRSPVSGLIENAVVEMYRHVPCMDPFATNEQVLLESSKTLNILYVFNGTYEPYLIHRLFPLQMAFKQTTPAAEHPYELAMYLHSLHRHLFPSWGKILAMAESVMYLLEREDRGFFAHLQQAFKKNITIDPKDFLADLMLRERDGAQGISTLEEGSHPRPDVTKELLTSPVIFLRKWMGEGFVGVLKLPAVLLIWDQLFMQDWNPRVMHDFCASILLLLKDSFMAADDHQAIREVFLSCASCLLTTNIRRAWIHLQQGGSPADIPGFNGLNQRPLVDLSPPRHGSALAWKTHLSATEVAPTGVKDILLTIALPDPQAEAVHPDAFLQNVDPSPVKLTIGVCCGPEKLCSKTISFNPSLRQKTWDQIAHLHKEEFPFEPFVFDSVDLTAFLDVPDSKPYFLLKVTGNPEGKGPLTVGWQKLDAFVREATDLGVVWAPQEFSTLLPLNPGEVPETVVEHPFGRPPEDSAEGHSTLQLTVYGVVRQRPNLASSPERKERVQGSPFLCPPWVPHDPGVALPGPPRTGQPFDLYLDALHYIPDNATIVKVTGQLKDSGLSHLPPIVAFPVLESPARNPEFRYRVAINEGVPAGMNSNTQLLFHVHTIDADSDELVLLGSCVMQAFNAQGELNVGGFQLKLRAGLLADGPSSLALSSLEQHATIPCCTLLVRLLPHTQMLVPPPSYWKGYYFTDGAKPNNSELGIISTFQKDHRFPELVLDMVVQLTEKQQIRVPPEQLEAWCVAKLNEREPKSPPALLKSIEIHRAVRYRQEVGVRVRIRQAFGLKADGRYVNALARVLKGAASMQLPELTQHWGGEEKFLMQQLDFSSLQRSPRWTDPSVVLHPSLDTRTVLLVQLYGLDAVYIPDPSRRRPGKVVPPAGQALELNAQSQLGWTALPLFDRNYVRSGVHNAPLFQGAPTAEFLQRVVDRPVKDVMAEGLKSKRLQLLKGTHASIAVEIWDGHYFDDEHPELLVIHDLLAIDKTKRFLAIQARKKGQDMSQLVLKTLGQKLRKVDRNSLEYQHQERLYKEAMENAFYNVVETALLNAGYSPL